MGFWQYGLQGQNAFPTSGGVTTPYSTLQNLSGAKAVASFSLNSGINMGDTYRILLNTFSLGTQLYLECYPTNDGDVSLRQPVGGTGTLITHHIRLALKSGNNWIYPNMGYYQGAGTQYFSEIRGGSAGFAALNFNIYNYFYCMFMENNIPGYAYPRGGDGAGLTNQIAMVSYSDHVSFYLMGHSCSFEVGDVTYHYDCPCVEIGSISNTYLEDGSLFDAGRDGMSEEDSESSNGEGGGNIPGLPTSPKYPSDDIDFPSLPSGASAFGFSKLALYKCTDSILASALDILYSDSTESTLETIIESCKKWWYKPDQYCLSLMLSPVDATTSASKNIKFGKYDSGVSAPFVTSQWHTVDCGSIDVPLKYGSFIDFEPHAKAKLFVPFVGFRSISINEIIGSKIYIKYHIDILTGVGVCMVKVVKQQSSSSVLYTYDCNVNLQVPLTANNYNQVVSSLLSASMSAVSGNGMGAVAGLAQAGSAMGSPDLSQSGSLSPNSGILSVLTPFVAIQMPVPSIPSGYNEQVGKPSNVYTSIGNVNGFTVCEDIHVNIPGATSEEISMIEDAFHTGVFV